MKHKIIAISSTMALVLASAVLSVAGAQRAAAVDGFVITEITADVDCNGTGQVFFTGDIPAGGFTLELMDKAADNSGPFISTVPPTIITITTGGSPVAYTMPLDNWSPPHYRVDSNFDTKSASRSCEAAPTETPVPPTATSTSPPPTATNTTPPGSTATNTPVPTATHTSVPGSTSTSVPTSSNRAQTAVPTATPAVNVVLAAEQGRTPSAAGVTALPATGQGHDDSATDLGVLAIAVASGIALAGALRVASRRR